MTAKDIVAELKKFGTEKTKKMWLKHGAQEPCLGVQVADMKKIQKRVKMDYQVALDLYDTGKVDPAKLEKILPEMVSLRPRGLREHLGLNKPIFARTSAYGHFGRAPDVEGGFSWEKTDLASELSRAF